MSAPFSSLEEALAWLDSHIDFESKMPTRRTLPTLERMWELVHLLGDPQEAFAAVHLTGTNGKGSTAAMVTSLFQSKGLSVGTYTSPNLERVNDRLARGGVPIDDDRFVEVLDTVARAVSVMVDRPTRFEILTAAALGWFADEAVDVAVVEVGLGGTWDSTNVVRADVAVLTNISYDHTEVLGPTLEGIALDKTGIVKPGSVAVVGETDPGLVRLIEETANERGASQVWVRDREFACTSNRVAVGGRLVDLRTPGAAYGEVLVPLRGAHQGLNAACAVAAAEAFFSSPLSDEVVEEGLGAVRVPGRLEVVGRRPLWVVDGAHNVAGMSALAAALQEEFSVDDERWVVIGMLEGRDPLAMLEALVPAGIHGIVACAPDSPRALPPEVVAEAAQALGLPVETAATVREAVAVARAQLRPGGMGIVAGSLYVVTDARALLLEGAHLG